MEYIIYESDTNLFIPESVMHYLGFSDSVNAANNNITGLPFLPDFEKVVNGGVNYYKTESARKGGFSAGDGDTLVYKDSSEVGL